MLPRRLGIQTAMMLSHFYWAVWMGQKKDNKKINFILVWQYLKDFVKRFISHGSADFTWGQQKASLDAEKAIMKWIRWLSFSNAFYCFCLWNEITTNRSKWRVKLLTISIIKANKTRMRNFILMNLICMSITFTIFEKQHHEIIIKRFNLCELSSPSISHFLNLGHKETGSCQRAL